MSMARKREAISVTLPPDMTAFLHERVALEGLPLSRILERLLRIGLEVRADGQPSGRVQKAAAIKFLRRMAADCPPASRTTLTIAADAIESDEHMKQFGGDSMRPRDGG